MPQPTADPAQTRADLAVSRPDLLGAYDAALPGARAAILHRLHLAVEHEPLPGNPVAGPATEPPDTDPVALTARLWPGSRLVAEVANSVANLALARAAAHQDDAAGRTPPLPAPGDPDGPGRLEQSVVDGHPLHPCCRTRAGMTVDDVLRYAPEHRPVIRLRRLAVPPERWHGTGAPVLLAHPWQAARLTAQYPWLTDAGETGPVRPLMSLRTVAPLDGGPHVKTAVDVQMTSAVRTVSPAAVHNGPRLSALLRRLTADLPLSVLAETEAGAVITGDGPDRRLAHLVREAPRLAADETAVPLGVLATSPMLLATAGDPYLFLQALGRVLIAPLAQVLDRGVALEAHGQNTLIVLGHGIPRRALYRDLGGVRVHAGRVKAAGLEPPDLHGDLPADDPADLCTKLAAAFGTAATHLVTALAEHRGADPDRLWAIIAAALRASGATDVPVLLTAPLPVKATTAMRLADDPLRDIWTHRHNPMAAHA